MTRMDWGMISTLLAVIFFIVMLVLALKVTKRKKPVWAYKTTKIIGLGSNAPPELKLTFSDRPVSDVYQTTFIFFNKGTEAIRKDDMTESLTIHFKGAEILRQPIIKAKSKEAIEFSAKQVVKEGDNSIQIGFLYLDHEDGAVVEVLHTASEEITCYGNIIGASEIRNIGEFKPSRPRLLLTRLIISLAPVIAISGVFVYYSLTLGFKEEPIIVPLVLILAGLLFVATLIPSILSNFRYRKFPRWSRNILAEPLVFKGESLQAYCVRCRAKVLMAKPRTIIMRNGKPAIQGVCSDCGTKLFRILP